MKPDPRRTLALLAGWLVAAAGLLGGVAAAAESRSAIQFRPDRLEKCDWFLVTEFSVSAIGAGAPEPSDDLLFTDALGVMRNIDRSRAVGISLDAHVAKGGVRLTPTVRVRQWLARRSSVELTLGYAHTPLEQDGVFGVIGDVRYSPAPWFHVRAGVCRTREVQFIRYVPELNVDATVRTHFNAGVGVGEVPGVVAWGAQAILFAMVVALFAGSN